MTYGLTLVTAPTVEPLTLPEAKRQCQLADSVSVHDGMLLSLITAARSFCEQVTNRQLCTATRKLILDCFPCSLEPILLPFAPLQSVSSIAYLDAAGDTQTWSSSEYRVSTATEPGRIMPAFGETYPTTRNTTDAVTVQYVCGYGLAVAVPMPLKQAMLLLIGHWFANREAAAAGSMSEVPMAVESLLNAYKIGDEFVRYGGAA